MRRLPGDGVAGDTVTSTASAPLIRSVVGRNNSTDELLPGWVQGLTGHDEPEDGSIEVSDSLPACKPIGEADECGHLLAACDRATPTTRRDLAMVTLLVRLGERLQPWIAASGRSSAT
jgi:hypothetical protein